MVSWKRALYLALRVGKLLAVSLWMAGVVGAFCPIFATESAPPFCSGARVRCDVGIASVMSSFLGQSPFTLWALGSMLLSFFSLQVTLYSVGREGRRNWSVALLSLLSLVAALFLMVLRPNW